MKKLAVFASGSGTNFQAMIDAIVAGDLPAEICLLVCDNPHAKALERAKKYGIDTFSFDPKDYPTKEQFEVEILAQLESRSVDLIVLAGYMRLIGDTLLNAYPNRIINIHPSLLPSFPGKDAIGQALRFGVKVTGVTIHYVDKGMDTGKIIVQEAVPIVEGDTRESLHERIQKVEHSLYVKTIKDLLNGLISL